AAVPSERAVAVLLPDPGGDEDSRGDDDELGGGGYPAVHEAAELARPGTSVLPLALAKGLEFDVVVVVDPERVLARSPQGMQDLYVGATRATQELILVQPGGFGTLLSGIRDRLDDSAQELTA
ncbi:ATP-binding domain-containing protein, partial [Dietzia sp. DQ11-71]